MSYVQASRRSRRPDSLASAVESILGEIQCPVVTSAMRVILRDRGRPTTAEQLGRLAAYQREDFARTHTPPVLCWAITPDGSAPTPRWWALGEWRLGRRIHTPDAAPVWRAHLAVWLTTDLARRPQRRSPDIKTLALGTAAQVLGPRIYGGMETSEDWAKLRSAVYEPYQGAMANLTGLTPEQAQVEAQLTVGAPSASALLFGRATASTSPA